MYKRSTNREFSESLESAGYFGRLGIKPVEQIVIDDAGNCTMVDSPLASAIGNALGTSTVARASHIEPANPVLRFAFRVLRRLSMDDSPLAAWTRTWGCTWRIDTTPVGGRVLQGRWHNRQDAINYEIGWLHRHFTNR